MADDLDNFYEESESEEEDSCSDYDDYGSEDELLATIRKGPQEVAKLLNSGADVNAKGGEDGDTPLTLAARRGSLEIVKMLLDRGADIDEQQFRKGKTALHYALESGHEAVIKLLIERGADVHCRDWDERNAMQFAIKSGKEQLVQMLLDLNVQAKTADICKRTPLHIAVGHYDSKKNEKIVKLLLDRGVDIEAKDDCGHTPLQSAIKYGTEGIVKLLIERGAKLKDDAFDMLHWTIGEMCGRYCFTEDESKKFNVIKLLLDLGMDVDSTNDKNETPLSIAADSKYPELIELLLARGANVNCKNKDGKSILHLVCQRGHESIVRELLARGVDVTVKDNNQETALHAAVQGGNIDIVKILLDIESLDVNAQGNKGQTAFSRAVDKNNIDLIKLLLSRGANVVGITSLNHLCAPGCEEFVKLLLEAGVDPNAGASEGKSLLHSAVASKNEDLVKLLLDCGADFSFKDSKGNNLLHLAVKSNNENLVKIFLDKGLNAYQVGESIMNPLYEAASVGNVNIMKLLLQHGVYVDRADSNNLLTAGSTALHVAVQKGHVAAVRLLVKHRANIHAEDDDGRNILHYAVVQKNASLVKSILALGFDVNAKTKKGESALYLAIESGLKKNIGLLLDQGIDIHAPTHSTILESPVHLACLHRHHHLVKYLLERGANIEDKNTKGYSLLTSCIKLKRRKVVRILLDYGVDLEARDATGNTPLYNAIIEGNERFDDRLEAIGKPNYYYDYECDSDYYDHCRDPFYIETMKSLPRHIHEDIVEQLLDHGAKVDEKVEGLTPLHYALEQSGAWLKVQLLLMYGADVNINSDENNCSLSFANDMGYANSTEVIIPHIVKMTSCKLPISKSNMKQVNQYKRMDEENRKLFTKCQDEIKRMKKAAIGNSGVTFYHLLICNDVDLLTAFAKNKEIIKVFKSREHHRLFPSYAKILSYQLKKGAWRKLLLEKVQGFFDVVYQSNSHDEGLPKLPAICCATIANHLSNRDLRSLIAAANVKVDTDIYDVRVG